MTAYDHDRNYPNHTNTHDDHYYHDLTHHYPHTNDYTNHTHTHDNHYYHDDNHHHPHQRLLPCRCDAYFLISI